MQRREWLAGAAALGGLGLAGCASVGVPGKTRVLVVGGGYGGATAAKYVRLFSNYTVDVVLVEPNENFVSCPISNVVLGGTRTMADITRPYSTLEKNHGVRIVRDMVASIDPAKKVATLASGPTIAYDKMILAPGIDLQFDTVEGLRAANADGRVLHAWKAGAETAALRRQLEAMPDGGVYVLSIPLAPYRCPPGTYERACQVASYFKSAKPRSKVLVLDANPDVTSKGPLFKKAWADLYPGIVEYRSGQKVVGVDAARKTLKLEVGDDVRGDVLNVVPQQRAGLLAVQTGLATANARWCPVDYLTFESTVAKDIHVIGDSILLAPAMPKSGHMANSHAKVAAAAVVARLAGWPVNPAPMLTNTCYSFVDASRVVHVASVHAYDPVDKTFKTVPGSGGLSPAANEKEGLYAWNWARTIWSDMLV
ncbi:NAD(P)/FAD-dependent oxidoreductase [Calidifontimicrobium sp. SYSU G02091]|uniref:NAD(P)/FAD-dependent oxidoreductase n=1 Tax=Calidifontimicrobium sp. SYSU G02091 TaxID=2926421 RepID=UPI001F52F49D|nr:NAD(P)/FAD-dependent oxidoreductase [Calidifontimicrobium sp. SYSU G02091]MCI1193323.1 NAD(P)/FAD-dependent oxidoreductase [Calidifontimicrobium sp. SYSU G02091]